MKCRNCGTVFKPMTETLETYITVASKVKSNPVEVEGLATLDTLKSIKTIKARQHKTFKQKCTNCGMFIQSDDLPITLNSKEEIVLGAVEENYVAPGNSKNPLLGKKFR